MGIDRTASPDEEGIKNPSTINIKSISTINIFPFIPAIALEKKLSIVSEIIPFSNTRLILLATPITNATLIKSAAPVTNWFTNSFSPNFDRNPIIIPVTKNRAVISANHQSKEETP